jgi:ElaB/YqjD/DUF883 family membrane-anchored ribosome-binding protein
MIATNETISSTSSVRNLGVVHVPSDQGSAGTLKATENAMQTTQLWIEKHPTAAVVASVAVGLLVGYLVKRRS